jgi:hypothetical protein
MTSDMRPVPLADATESFTTDLSGTSQEDIGQHLSRPIFMNIDYSLGVQETYQTFAKACAAAGRFCKILNAVLARQYSPTPRHWPSWVPEWRLPPAATILLSPTVISLLRHISQTCLKVVIRSPRHWNYRAGIDGSRQAASHYHIESTSSSSRATAERLLSYMIELYRIVCRSEDDFTPGGLATVVKLFWPLMHNVDVDLLTNCLTRLWDNAVLRYSNSLVQHDKRLARQLQEALRGQSFFTASNTEHILFMHGFGNAEIKPGDRVNPIWKDQTWHIGHDLEQNDALILRPKGESSEGETIYRLIGSASVFPVFIHGHLREPAGSFRLQILLE